MENFEYGIKGIDEAKLNDVLEQYSVQDQIEFAQGMQEVTKVANSNFETKGELSQVQKNLLGTILNQADISLKMSKEQARVYMIAAEQGLEVPGTGGYLVSLSNSIATIMENNLDLRAREMSAVDFYRYKFEVEQLKTLAVIERTKMITNLIEFEIQQGNYEEEKLKQRLKQQRLELEERNEMLLIREREHQRYDRERLILDYERQEIERQKRRLNSLWGWFFPRRPFS